MQIFNIYKTQTILVINKLMLSNVIRRKTKFRRNRSILCTHACSKIKQRTIEKIKIKIKKKKRRSVHKGVRIIFVLQFKISLTLRSFWGWFTKAMKRHVATTLDRFVGQSLLEFTQRTDVLLPTEHQRRITLVSRFFESAVNNLNTIQIIVNLIWQFIFIR